MYTLTKIKWMWCKYWVELEGKSAQTWPVGGDSNMQACALNTYTFN